jgi:general stress protein YciG
MSKSGDEESARASDSGRSRKGFAAMDPELQRELSRRGGRAAQRVGTAHKFSSEEARVAGRKSAKARSRQRAKEG